MTRSATQHPPARELVEHFFQATTMAWEPWLRTEGGQWTIDLKHVNKEGGFETTTPARMSGLFLASGVFETPRVIGEITYGDKEFSINAVAGRRDSQLRYGLWEWADALDRRELVPRNTDFVTQPERLHSIVTDMAAALRVLADRIACADLAVIDRLEGARALVRSAWDAELRETEHAGRVRSANEAFRLKNWKRVIELLSLVEDRLTKAERAKLRYARLQG